jgi:hypothetical protein
MPSAVHEYFLVSGDELKEIKDAKRPFLNYSQLYDTIAKEAEQEKLPISRWRIFDWRLT